MAKYFLAGLCSILLFVGCVDQVPRQIHLSVQSNSSTSVTVTWVTTSADDTVTQQVEYGQSPGSYTDVADGSSHSRPNEPPGFVHDVEITGLLPDTTYYYRCGDSAAGWSDEHSFTTAPAMASDFSFAVIGDMGVTYAAQQNLAQMMAYDPSFTLHTGDLGYANGLQLIWDSWFEQIAPLASQSLYMPSPGNHEYEDSFELSSYLGRFALPNNEYWYSFDWGNTHVVSLDTESPYTAGSDQLVWLEGDLATASSDPDIDWIIVFFHRPPYSASPAHGSNLSIRANICPLMDTYGVDLVLAGHDHLYERTYPLFNEAVVDTNTTYYTNPGGPIYVVTGGGGVSLYETGSEYWTVYTESFYHHVKVEIQAGGTLHLQAISMDGDLRDECWIYK